MENALTELGAGNFRDTKPLGKRERLSTVVLAKGVYDNIFHDYNQPGINLIEIPPSRAFIRESWKINLRWLEIWYELSSVPLGSLPPQKVLADSDSHELLFHPRSNGIK